MNLRRYSCSALAALLVGGLTANVHGQVTSSAAVIDGQEAADVLEAHNHSRRDWFGGPQEGLPKPLPEAPPPLVWSPELSAYALEWLNAQKDKFANELQNSDTVPRFRHRPEAGDPEAGNYAQKYGENIYWVSGGSDLAINAKQAVASWQEEGAWIVAIARMKGGTFWDVLVGDEQGVKDDKGQQVQTGHFTQIMWYGTRRVGGAKCTFNYQDSNGRARRVQVVVCNYDPRGNNSREAFWGCTTPPEAAVEQIANQINQARMKAGLPVFTLNEDLRKFAQDNADKMSKNLAVDRNARPNYQGGWQAEFGANGTETAEVAQMLTKARAIGLDPNNTEFGMGVAIDPATRRMCWYLASGKR